MSKDERVIYRNLRPEWEPPPSSGHKGTWAPWKNVEKWPASAYPKFYGEAEQRALRGFVNRVEDGQQPTEDEAMIAAALVRYILTMSGRPRMHAGGNKQDPTRELINGVRASVLVEEFESQGLSRTAAVERAALRIKGYSARKVWDAIKQWPLQE